VYAVFPPPMPELPFLAVVIRPDGKVQTHQFQTKEQATALQSKGWRAGFPGYGISIAASATELRNIIPDMRTLRKSVSGRPKPFWGMRKRKT
jgi:hypothetical protein